MAIACKPVKDRRTLPSGKIVFVRPRRNNKRIHRPSDLRRITRYVACDFSVNEALCAVLQGAELDDDVAEVARLLDEIIEKYDPFNEAPDQDFLEEILNRFGISAKDIIEALQKLIEMIKNSRIYRWFLRRTLIGPAIMYFLEYLVTKLIQLEDMIIMAERLRQLLEWLNCTEVSNGSED